MIILSKKLTYQLFIQTAKTPNPNFLKFLPITKVVLPGPSTLDITNMEQAIQMSPMARKLFKIPGITRVFYGPNYVSIAKQQKIDWNDIKPIIFNVIQEHFQSNQPLIYDKSKLDNFGIQQDDSETIKMIKEILTTRVRPTVQDDGGDVKFISFDSQSGVLKLKLLGSCSGCPSSSVTLKNGIYKMMKHYIAQVKSVISDDTQ